MDINVAVGTLPTVKQQKELLITVTLYEVDGVYVDFSDMSIIEQENEVNEIVLNTISDVLNDKFIVILGYKDKKAYNDRRYYFGASYYVDESKEDNDIDGYHLFTKKINSSVKGIKKLFKYYTGIIEISNWSGTEYKIFIR